MEESLEKGMAVILDGTFGDPELLHLLVQPLLRAEIAYFILSCDCPEPVALQRIQTRFTAGQSESDARPEVYQQQKSRSDWNFASHPYCLIDTTLSLEQQMLQVFRAL